jgi:HAD superfamily phosphoserine phosphatase-like hydrolase
VKTERPAEVIARISAAMQGRTDVIVATDGDGTLWSGDIGDDLFHALVASERILEDAHEALRNEAERAGIDAIEGRSAIEVARRLEAEYHAGRFSEERIFEMMAWAFAGWTREEVHAFARGVMVKEGIASRAHAEALEIVSWAEKQRVRVYLVSASPHAVVEEAAIILGLDAAIIATVSRYDGERMLPDVERPIPYGAGKVSALRAAAGDVPIVCAMGDNVFDLPMLASSRVPVAIRPKARLREKAGELLAMVELQPG